MTEDKFIRVKSGSIYRWTEMLMKRRDAVEVDGHTAAKYFRDQGIENDITAKYPLATQAIPTPKPASKAKKAPAKSTAGGTAKTVVTDEPVHPDKLLEGLLPNVPDVP